MASQQVEFLFQNYRTNIPNDVCCGLGDGTTHLNILSSLFEDSSLKEETEMTFKGDKAFSYVFENVDFQKENVIRISFTNNIDYTKIIFEQTVTFIS